MRKVLSKILGVTLLEVMLVLAIAAMILVMSIRYYQSTSASQQANSLISQLQAIVGAADSIAAGTGDYSKVDDATVKQLIGENGLKSVFGTITITGSATSYSMSGLSVPATVCNIVKTKITLINLKTTDCATFTYSPAGT